MLLDLFPLLSTLHTVTTHFAVIITLGLTIAAYHSHMTISVIIFIALDGSMVILFGRRV